MLKALIKSSLRVIATLLVLPCVLSHRIFSILSSPDLSLESHSQLFALVPGKTGNLLRVAFYRRTLEHCDPTATICFGSLFSKTGASIGKHVYVGPYCQLGLVTLEDDVLIGPSVHIPSGARTHNFTSLDVPFRLQGGIRQRLTVAKNCWIGASAIILTNIQEGTVIAAGSVVTRTPDPTSLNAGIPSKKIRDL